VRYFGDADVARDESPPSVGGLIGEFQQKGRDERAMILNAFPAAVKTVGGEARIVNHPAQQFGREANPSESA
jgi:hypothetical protein